MPDGRCKLYKGIWARRVPMKIPIFAWRLSQEGLSTQSNRKHRKLTESALCEICGREENGHHAVVGCTKARALRHEMKKIWDLPDEAQFQFVGTD
jgi:hypothetical protein